VLQIGGFGALSGIAMNVACLTVNQIANVMGVALANRGTEGAKKSRDHHDKAAEARGWPNLLNFMVQSTTNKAKITKTTCPQKRKN
jgi:hypothetical protein